MRESSSFFGKGGLQTQAKRCTKGAQKLYHHILITNKATNLHTLAPKGVWFHCHWSYHEFYHWINRKKNWEISMMILRGIGMQDKAIVTSINTCCRSLMQGEKKSLTRKYIPYAESICWHKAIGSKTNKVIEKPHHYHQWKKIPRGKI